MFGKKDLIPFIKEDVFTIYNMMKLIGEGGFSKVYLVKHKISGEIRSLKRIIKANLEEDLIALKNELEILAKADYPNIINVYEVYTTSTYLDIVMEYCKGGSLLDRINDLLSFNKCFTEEQAAIIIKQIAHALNYAHKNGIVHRDIKLENILFLDEHSNNLNLKLIDFGLSQRFEKGIKKMREKLGTSYYMSPEILDENYTEKCDIWALGVLLYILLIGVPPFYSEKDDDEEVFYKIKRYDYSFNNQYGIKISDTAKDLIKKLLSPEPKRLTAEQILEHEFVKNLKTSENLNTLLSQNYNNLQVNLRSFLNSSNMRKVILTCVANRLSYADIDKLHDIFIELDTNNDGSISYDEFKNGLKIMEKEDPNIQGILNELFQSIDTDHSMKINYSEFIAAAMDKKFYENQDKLLEIFYSLDKNKDGKISISEFENILNLDHNKNTSKNDDSYESFKKEFEKYDLNNDGEIDYNEFVAIVTKRKDVYLPKKPNKL